MQKFLNWLEKVLTPMAKTVGENKYLIAITFEGKRGK